MPSADAGGFLAKGSAIYVMIALLVAMVLPACKGEEKRTLHVAGIPDQSATRLARRYGELTSYLERELDVDVKYIPTVDYAAAVIAFRQGSVHLGWFGGLTGVMARREVPGSVAIAQRPRDRRFHSVFIVGADVEAESLQDLRGLTFTFGSELSTSGHLMPRHFLLEDGVDPEIGFKGKPNFSGSHDKTWKLVESGAFQAGALSVAVWEAALRDGRVDTGKVRVLNVTPPYFDYNWTVRGDVDQIFGNGFTERVRNALLKMGDGQRDVLELFSAEGFVPSDNSNYEVIEGVARDAGILR